jgi:hypothetical protein
MKILQNSSCKDGTLLTVGFSLRTWKASITSKSRRDGTLSIDFFSLCLCFLLGCSSKQIDGSEPTGESALWTEPVACDAKQIKAKAFYLGKASITTIQND